MSRHRGESHPGMSEITHACKRGLSFAWWTGVAFSKCTTLKVYVNFDLKRLLHAPRFFKEIFEDSS